MFALSLRSSTILVGASVLVATGVLSSRSSGVEGGVRGVPMGASYMLGSCADCHDFSDPYAGRTDGPTTVLDVADLVVQEGQTTNVTVSVSGGVSGTSAGFLCEATDGAFTGGNNNHESSSGLSVTHDDRNSRSWSFTWTAPNAPGVVELTAVAMATNGSGTGGDRFAFSGYDNNALQGTPTRVMVLPAGVTNLGIGCADSFGNQAVLGTNSVATPGNGSFAFELHGAGPNVEALLYCGFNPAGYAGIDLGPLYGMTGCMAWVNDPLGYMAGTTTSGSVERAEGSVVFSHPLNNDPAIIGQHVDYQCLYRDDLVARGMPFSMSNGLRVTVQ